MVSKYIAKTWKKTEVNVIISGFRKSDIVLFEDTVGAREKCEFEALKCWHSQNTIVTNRTTENNTSNEITSVHAFEMLDS